MFKLIRIGLVLLFACCNQITNAQTINLSDSLYRILKNKPTPTAKFDSRNSFVTGNSAKVFGIKAGLSFNRTLTIGIGYNWIATDLTAPVRVNAQWFDGEIHMRYIAPFLEYSFYKKGNWEAMVPVQLGFGRSFQQAKTPSGDVNLNIGQVILYELGMNVEYKIMNVVGVGGGLGYRLMLKNNRTMEQQFTSPVYVLRIRLIFDEILKRARTLQSGDE